MKKKQTGGTLQPIESTYVKEPVDLLLLDQLNKNKSALTLGYKTDQYIQNIKPIKRSLESYKDVYNDSGPSKSKSKDRFWEKENGGLIDIMGYKDNSPYKHLPYIDINSNSITMEGVSKPVLAVPDGDKPIVMKPGGNYHFPKSKTVREYKMYEEGGDIEKTAIKQELNNSLDMFMSTLTDKEKKQFLRDYNELDDKERALFYQTLQHTNRKTGEYQTGGVAGLQMESLGLDYVTLLAKSQKPIIKYDEKKTYEGYHLDKHMDHGIRLGPDGKYYNQDGTRALRGEGSYTPPKITKQKEKPVTISNNVSLPELPLAETLTFYEVPPAHVTKSPYTGKKELKLLELNIPDENIKGRRYPVITENFNPKIREQITPLDNTQVKQTPYISSDRYYYDPYLNRMIIKNEFKK